MNKFLSLFVLLGFIASLQFTSTNSFAEEHGGGAAPEGKEGGEKEGGGGEGAGGASHGGGAKGKGESKAAELMSLQSEVQSLESSVRAKKENLKKLVEEKQHISDPSHGRELIKTIEKEYKDYRETEERLQKKRTQLQFRFPEKGITVKKESKEVESLKDIEEESSIDLETTQMLKLLRSQYGVKSLPKEHKKSEKIEKPKAPHSDDLDTVIRLKK